MLSEKGRTALSSSSMTPSPELRVLSEESAAAMSSSQAPEVFKPTAVFYVAMSMMAILTLVVALDVTALAVALPVRYLSPHDHWYVLTENL
jgi:hypothetical protein